MGKLEAGKKIKKLLIVIIVLLILTFLIFLTEKTSNDNFDNIFDSLWFMLVTISTVGYGDVYPTTIYGRALTLALILVTPVLLIQILSLVKDLFAGSLLPQIRLLLNYNKDWYIFDELNEKSIKLIADIKEKNCKNCIIIFKTINNNFDINSISSLIENKDIINLNVNYDDLLSMKNNLKVFLVSNSDEINKINIAQSIENISAKMQKNVNIYQVSNFNYDYLSNNIHIINFNKMIAQDFISKYNKKFNDEKILVIGNNVLTEYIFEALIVNNVYDKTQKNEYTIITKNDNFKYYYHSIISYLNENSRFSDTINVYENLYDNVDLIRKSNIIILCDDNKNVDNLNYINRLFTNGSTIYMKSQNVFKTQNSNIKLFGNFEEIFTYDNVVNEKYYENARKLNDIYKSRYGGKNWEDLDSFKKESNIVSYNHTKIKKRLLDNYIKDEICYMNKLNKLTNEEKYTLYEIEHERWCRFHYVYNWEYSKVRNDSEKKHNLLVPFDKLNDIEKEKNKEAYELIDEFIF